MTRKLALALALALLSAPLLAQPAPVASPRWKPPVANEAALPATGNTTGDTRVALDTFVHYTWDGDSWETSVSGGGAGAVTSVALAVPAEWSVSGSPITGAGTITIAEATQTANTVYAGPASGGAVAPGFRALVSADIPNNAADTSGNAATATTATTASDLSCTDCIGGTEIDESTLGAVPTATALAANGANCLAGQYPLGVDASGAAESCTADDTGTDDQTATEVAYTPTTGTDWVDPDPASAGEGLDDLAARLTIEEAKADDDVPESGDFGAAADLESDGSLSADVVAAAEMADADHGDVSWSGGVATVDSGAVGLTELADDATCTAGQDVRRNVADTAFECYTASGAGDVVGPASATDNAIARYDLTTGKLIQDSSVTVDDAGMVTTGSATYTTAVKVGDFAGIGWDQRNVLGNTSRDWTRATDGGADISGFYAQTLFAGDGPTSVGVLAQHNVGVALAPTNVLAWSGAGINTTLSTPYTADLGLSRAAAGVAKITDGSTGIGALLTARSVEASTAGSGAPNVLVATESFKVFTNEGSTAANYHTLNSAAAGPTNTWCVQDADGIRITAAGVDTIRVIDKVTAAGGYIESTTIGSCVTLLTLNATEHFAHPINGVWTDGTFTYDDTGLTSP